MTRFRSMLVAAAMLGAAGCDEGRTVGPASFALDEGLLLTTDATRYEARPLAIDDAFYEAGFRIRARFENRTDRTLYLENCYSDWTSPTWGIAVANGGGDAAYDPAWACVGHDGQIEVKPGEVREDVIDVRGPTARDGITNEPLGRFEGRFRLVYHARTCRGDEFACNVPFELTSSNEFEVVRED